MLASIQAPTRAQAATPIQFGALSATRSNIMFGASNDNFAIQIPTDWPESLKELFSKPDRGLDLAQFEVSTKGATLAYLGNRLALYTRQIPGTNILWEFAHRVLTRSCADGQKEIQPNLPSAAVHALTLVQDKDGQEYVFFVREKRLPITRPGQDSQEETKTVIQCPAGIVDKPDTPLMKLGMKEVEEETPFRAVAARTISHGPVPTSAGLTTEQKAFIAVRAVYDPTKQVDLQDAEQYLSQKGLLVPFEVFKDRTRFNAWMAEQYAKGEEIGPDVTAIRGYLF